MTPNSYAKALTSHIAVSEDNKDNQKQFALGWQGQQRTFTLLPQGYIDSPALFHNLVLWGPGLSFPSIR